MLSDKRIYALSSDCQRFFEGLKVLPLSTPVLCASDFSRKFTICVDASDAGIGSVLCLEVENVLMTVVYMSKKLKVHQRKNSVIEKEAQAVIKSTEKFEPYIGKGTIIYSDYSPMKFVETMKANDARLARLSVIMQDKDVEIHNVFDKLSMVATLYLCNRKKNTSHVLYLFPFR